MPSGPANIHPSRTPMQLEGVLPWVLGVVLSLPVILSRYPPMTDLPHHEALVGLLRHFRDPALGSEGLYFVNPGHPNQLFYGLAWALSLLVATDTACKLVIAATQIAIVVCAARLARHLGTTRWTCFLVAPLAMGWIFFWGLVGNLLGIAVLLAVLPALDRFAMAPSPRRAAGACGAIVLLYLAHESVMMVGCAACVVFALGQPLGRRGTAVRLLPAVLGAVLFLGHQIYVTHLLTPTIASGSIYGSPLRKLTKIPQTIFGPHDLESRLLLAGLGAAAVVAFAMARARSGRPPRPRHAAAFAHHYRFELLGGLIFAGYLLMPTTFRGVTMLNDRFLGPAYAVLVVALAPPENSLALRLPSRALAAAMPFALLLLVWPQFADADQCYRDLDRLLPRIEKGSAIALLENDKSFRTRVYSAAPAGGRVMAERGGRTLYAFTRSPIAPVMMEAAYRWDEVDLRLHHDTMEFRPSHDLHRFRYVLLHSRDAQQLVVSVLSLQPEARLVETSGEWVLLESTLKPQPPMSAEGPPPGPADASLRVRMAKLVTGIAR